MTPPGCTIYQQGERRQYLSHDSITCGSSNGRTFPLWLCHVAVPHQAAEMSDSGTNERELGIGLQEHIRVLATTL